MLSNRLFASVKARYIEPWVLNHYRNTLYGKRIKELKSRFQGRRCFLVGNGPSLTVDDLSALHENHELSFGFNRIYTLFDDTEWRPDFYISQDEKILQQSSEMIDLQDLPVKFIPIQSKWYYGINIANAYYFNMQKGIEHGFEPENFSDNCDQSIYQAGTVMYTAAQLAAYMGFSEIILIGVDHHFRISQNMNGEIEIDNSVQDYFSDKYNQDRDKLYIPNTDKSTYTYIAIKKFCDQRGIRVLNGTRGGRLEVFPRVSFDSLFK